MLDYRAVLADIGGVPVQIRTESDVNCIDLTAKQAYGLGVIKTLMLRGFPPTHSEIARTLSVKRQTVEQLIVILTRKGYVLRDRGIGRSLRLTDKPLPYATQKKAA